jgi:hypothetical protein
VVAVFAGGKVLGVFIWLHKPNASALNLAEYSIFNEAGASPLWVLAV